ncbi:MAG: type II secretion system inner membrane protein GspF [Candidatus Binatus sp.]|uniref:type II secretion system inner membrane protein GspF n=1 Tax=Candidatus Binatus sp. TaxID=2811406 RepID=UPI0027217E06|nr:type II secretion system inner membrane protein GspF [Candidatus Binatus sp.]MDO8432971.1 type II secretion system inner membrane protein GspF [Candidatus Binatus sp.]
MPVFAYRGLAGDGHNVSGVIDADSARTARGKLRASGIFPTVLNEEAGAAERATAVREWFPSLWRRPMPGAELALLTRQLSALLGAGVQLVDALGVLSDQSTRAATKRMLSQVRERVREGSSLADALMAHRDTFSELYIGMVRAGEQAAALEAVLDRLAEYSERQSEFVTKVRGALTYPIIMMCVGTAIMGFLVAYVVPQVATVFEQQHAALPLATKILISLSAILTTYYLPILLLIIAIVAGIIAGLATPRGRRIYDTAILRLPYIGPTVIRVICARFARTLATLLSSGVQLLPALNAVKGVVTNGLLKDAIEKSRESIREGSGMGQTLSASGIFPPLLIEMIRVGERSGDLERMLERVADNYEREVSHSLSQMTTVLEPLMTVAMAAVIVFMMLAVLMPIFQLNQLMQ